MVLIDLGPFSWVFTWLFEIWILLWCLLLQHFFRNLSILKTAKYCNWWWKGFRSKKMQNSTRPLHICMVIVSPNKFIILSRENSALFAWFVCTCSHFVYRIQENCLVDFAKQIWEDIQKKRVDFSDEIWMMMKSLHLVCPGSKEVLFCLFHLSEDYRWRM